MLYSGPLKRGLRTTNKMFRGYVTTFLMKSIITGMLNINYNQWYFSNSIEKQTLVKIASVSTNIIPTLSPRFLGTQQNLDKLDCTNLYTNGP